MLTITVKCKTHIKEIGDQISADEEGFGFNEDVLYCEHFIDFMVDVGFPAHNYGGLELH